MNVKVDTYYDNLEGYKDEFLHLRDIMFRTDLLEDFKWGMPVYTINKKNVVGIFVLKEAIALWFYQGALLEDKHNKLRNAQEGKTQAMRNWKFSSLDEIIKNERFIIEYLNQAIDNQKNGRTVKLVSKPIIIPTLLQNTLDNNTELKDQFEALSKGKKRDYANHIAEAKREATKLSRLEKIVPMIRLGIGLHDQYK